MPTSFGTCGSCVYLCLGCQGESIPAAEYQKLTAGPHSLQGSTACQWLRAWKWHHGCWRNNSVGMIMCFITFFCKLLKSWGCFKQIGSAKLSDTLQATVTFDKLLVWIYLQKLCAHRANVGQQLHLRCLAPKFQQLNKCSVISNRDDGQTSNLILLNHLTSPLSSFL